MARLNQTALRLIFLLTLMPLHAPARALSPQYQTDQPAVTQALNDFWTLQGLGQTTSHVRANWGALLGSSDWYEWNSLKINWADAPADKIAQRNLLLRANITGVSAAGVQAVGYVWPSNGSESWLCPNAHFDQMPRFICAVFNDYLWSRDLLFLRQMRPRAEAVMTYMMETMQGRSGLLLCPAVYTGLADTSLNTTYMDCYREGGSVTWIEAGYYTALQDMAALENVLGDRQKGAGYAAVARKLPARFHARLWNGNTGRYVGWRDSGGTLHDYGFTYLNLEALARGLGTASEADNIFQWLDNGAASPTVMGGHRGSTDIYQCVVAPRSNTVPIPAADWDPWSVSPALRGSSMGYGALVEDGGAMLWVNFYDVMARLRWLDADSAWRKLTDMLFRVQGDPLRFTESVTHPTNIYGEGYLEVGPADGPENGLAGTSPLYGFMGIQPKPDGLYASPNLPTSLLSLTGSRVCYGSAVCRIRVSRGRMIVDAARPGQFRAAAPFSRIGLRLTNGPGQAGHINVRLQKQESRRNRIVWATVASSSVAVRRRDVYAYFPVPVQMPGTYRVSAAAGSGPGGFVCRAVLEPVRQGAALAFHASSVVFTAKKAFSDISIKARERRVGGPTLERRMGGRWRSVAATWTDGDTAGMLGFADQPAGLYRLRFARVVTATYSLLSNVYTIEMTNGVVATSSRVAAGETVKLNIVSGAPVGHRIVISTLENRALSREVFDVQDAGRGEIALKNKHTGRYLSVDASHGKVLQSTRATAIGPWERFTWRRQTSGAFALFSPAAGYYVSTDLSHHGRLSAGFAALAGSWEQLTWADRGLGP